MCLERGADPTNALRKQRVREARKAARLDAERRGGGEVVEEQQLEEDKRIPRLGGVGAEGEGFLRSIS